MWFIIYYTGLGYENGNWVVTKSDKENDEVTLEEVLSKIKFKRNVEIICDNCFAGIWAYQAEQMAKEGIL